jgi:hypothetical protein
MIKADRFVALESKHGAGLCRCWDCSGVPDIPDEPDVFDGFMRSLRGRVESWRERGLDDGRFPGVHV